MKTSKTEENGNRIGFIDKNAGNSRPETLLDLILKKIEKEKTHFLRSAERSVSTN